MAFITLKYKSQSLNMPVMINLIIPQGRGGYKILYLLHGAGGDYSGWVRKTRIDDYANDKNIVVVMPSGNNSFYVNENNGLNYYKFISKELPEYIEKCFNVSCSPKDRYIGGMSMGGYGAVNIALNNPGMFNTVFSYSGLLNILERYDKPEGIDMYSVFGKRQTLIDNNFDLYELINKISENERNNVDNFTKFYFTCGLQDKRIHMTKEFYHKMEEYGYKTKIFLENGNHDWKYWDKCIEKTIKYIIGEDELWQS